MPEADKAKLYSTHTTVLTNSAVWSTGFVHLSGDTMTGSLNTPTLSANSIYIEDSNLAFTGTTLASAASASGLFLSLTINGSAAAIPIYWL
jgi:hypothetical protein